MSRFILDVEVPYELPISGRKGADRLGRLVRRLEHLRERIEMSVEDLSHDKAEASALKFAIESVVNLEAKMAEIRKTAN